MGDRCEPVPRGEIHVTATADQIAEQILSDMELPTLSTVASRLIQVVSDPESTVREIADIIEMDPSLSMKLLRVANSAYFRRQTKATTIERAAVTLGSNYLKVVALGFQFSKAFEGVNGKGFDQGEFWRDSLLRACMARRLAGLDCPAVREEAFLVGLLQDLGIPVLARHFQCDYIEVFERARGCRGRLSAEETAEFEINHIHVVKRLCKTWSIPARISRPIERHHAQPITHRTQDENLKLWQYAYFVSAIPFSNEDEPEPIDNSLRGMAAVAFGMDLADLNDLFDATLGEFDAIKEIFDDTLPEDCQAELLLQQAAALIEAMGLDVPPTD
jgi:HD-like signal output (HDOD) protein